MRGLGALFTRDLKYDVTDTETGAAQSFTIVTGTGAFPSWAGAGPYSGAMALPGAWRAATLLADLLAAVPWHCYRDSAGGGPATRISPTPPLLEQPAPPDTRVTTLSSAALDYFWHGNAIGLIAARNRVGWPTAIAPKRAPSVVVRRVDERDPFPLPPGSIIYGIDGRWYAAADVWHVKGPCEPGALRGMGRLEMFLNGTLALAAEQTRQAGGLADHAVPSVVVKSMAPDLTPDEAEKLKASWMTAQKTRRPMVVGAGVDVEPVAWNPTETQLLEARKFSLHEIALIFGLDPSWLGAAQTSRVYSNIEQEAINLARYSLGGALARFEQAFTAAMPRGSWAKANLDSVMRADTLGRYQAHQIGITAGFLTPDEARVLEDWAPLTEAQKAELRPARPAPAGGGGPDDADPADDPVERALFERANLTGDGEDLREYWTRGPGLAKWATHPHPWTALYRHLLKYMTPDRARRTASAWFERVFGFAPGARKGRNPVGLG